MYCYPSLLGGQTNGVGLLLSWFGLFVEFGRLNKCLGGGLKAVSFISLFHSPYYEEFVYSSTPKSVECCTLCALSRFGL